MKRLILGATLCVALAATSCSKVETVDINQEAMEFGVTTNATTRATTYTVSNLSTFYATGWSHTDAWTSTAGSALSAFMTEETFSTNNTTTATPTVNYYWPDADKISLFATSESKTLTAHTDAGGYPTFSHTVADGASYVNSDTETNDGYQAYAVSNLTDLLIGSVTDQTGSAAQAVAFALDHALAKVSFNVKGTKDTYEYKISAVRMNDLTTTSTFTFNGGGNGVDGSWDPSVTGSADYVLTSIDKTVQSSTTGVDLAEDAGNEFIVMPQTFTGWILVKYTVTGVQSTAYWATAKVTTLSLDAGSKTTFNITLPETGGNVSKPDSPEEEDTTITAPSAMTFTVSVEENWTDGGSTDIASSDLTVAED